METLQTLISQFGSRMVGLGWVHQHSSSASYLSTMWAPNLPCGTRHCPALPRYSLPPCSRLRSSLACLLLLPSRTGGLLRVAPNHARSFGYCRGVTCVTSQGSRLDSSSMGFTQRQVFRLPSMAVEGVPSVAVIGAGAAGLAAGRILREEGLKVTIFERSRHVGGVWRYKPRDEFAPMCESTKHFRVRWYHCSVRALHAFCSKKQELVCAAARHLSLGRTLSDAGLLYTTIPEVVFI